MKKLLTVVAAFTLLFLPGFHLSLQEGKPVTLDMQITKDFPMVKIKVEGEEGTFIIDTGRVAEGVSVTPAFAKKAGLKGKSKATFTLGEGQNAIELKDLLIEHFKAGPEKDGILGCTFFEKVRMTFDPPSGKATFSTYDTRFDPPADAKRAAFEFVKGMKGPFVKAIVEGDKEVWVCVDTASQWSSINTDVFGKIFKNSSKEKLYGTTYSVATTSLKMGDVEIKDARFAKLTNAALKGTGSNVVGLVGLNVLKDYTVTFDYDKKEMFFSRSSK